MNERGGAGFSRSEAQGARRSLRRTAWAVPSWALLPLCLSGLSACENGAAATSSALPLDAPAGAKASATAEPESAESAFTRAEQAIATALQEPDLGGAPGFERERTSIVARAKAEPIVFLRAPEPDPTSSKVVLALRAQFEHTDYAWRTLNQILKYFKDDKRGLRQVVLTDGYLYSENANRAFTLVSMLTPARLFDGEPIWIQRGQRVIHAAPNPEGDYVFSDGSEAGKRVRLFHLDRVGTGDVPEPLHVDLRALKYQLFFDRAKIRHLTKTLIVADLRYGELWIPTLLRVNGARVELAEEAIAPEQRDALQEARTDMERQTRAVSQLRTAMRAAIDEGLPFDEPKTEYEQEDGKLRRVWRTAYEEGRNSYRYNDDRYSVFGKEGQPLVPQVCIDFMVDTFERAGGSWWLPQSAGKRERSLGRLTWGPDVQDLRRTHNFVQYADDHPQWFNVMRFGENERVELGYKDLFFNWLKKRVDEFAPGDIVLIRGMTPWDEVEEHSHSFFVYETDPVSGIPIAIAGNAGPANLWSWETEARRTPNRTLRTRIRPLLPWLESFLDLSSKTPLQPPELVSGKK